MDWVGQVTHICYVRNMMKTLKLVKVGEETAVILPEEILDALGVQEGDFVDLIDLPEGVELRPIRAEPE